MLKINAENNIFCIVFKVTRKMKFNIENNYYKHFILKHKKEQHLNDRNWITNSYRNCRRFSQKSCFFYKYSNSYLVWIHYWGLRMTHTYSCISLNWQAIYMFSTMKEKKLLFSFQLILERKAFFSNISISISIQFLMIFLWNHYIKHNVIFLYNSLSRSLVLKPHCSDMNFIYWKQTHNIDWWCLIKIEKIVFFWNE